MITGSLQKKKGLYYAVLNLYDDYGKRKPKWIPTGYTIKGNKKKAEEKLEQFKIEYEQKSKIQLRGPNIYDKYKNIFNKAKEDVKNIIPSLKNNPDKDKPLGDEDKKFKF